MRLIATDDPVAWCVCQSVRYASALCTPSDAPIEILGDATPTKLFFIDAELHQPSSVIIRIFIRIKSATM